MINRSDRVKAVEVRLQEHCDWIARMYKPGAKVTIIVRSPEEPDGYMMATSDDLAGITDVLGRADWSTQP